jgi:hypothetical protein
MITPGRWGVIALGALLAITLAGCDPHAADSPPTGSATPSETPTPTPTPTPSPDPSEVTEPPPGSGADALEPHDAYARCVTLVSAAQYPGHSLTIAGYGDADVILRTDGLFYIYVEVTVNDAPTPEQMNVAFECILGGTFAAPNDALYGTTVRAPLSERNPDSPLSTED